MLLPWSPLLARSRAVESTVFIGEKVAFSSQKARKLLFFGTGSGSLASDFPFCFPGP